MEEAMTIGVVLMLIEQGFKPFLFFFASGSWPP
jgi:hypothetical protein